jgi:NAD(P)-dependent dehydrogenase (short-subunit alcohol dehydrogenase family)
MSGVFFCSQAAARAMQAGNHGGVIINLSSMNSEAGVPWRASYCAAKAGVNLLTRTLAIEWAALGIRVNAVAPGWVATELTQGAVERGVLDIEKLKRVNPMNRIAEVEDVANAILFLASDQASYITGQTLFVDGGMVIGAVATAIR